jgi:hypothetical protein
MGAIAGFIAGYFAGINAGPQGFEELRKAWQAISSSEEFQGLVETATAFLQNMVAEGSGSVVEQISSLTNGRSEILEMISAGSKGGIGEALNKISETPEYQALFASGAALLGNVLSRASAVSERATQGH